MRKLVDWVDGTLLCLGSSYLLGIGLEPSQVEHSAAYLPWPYIGCLPFPFAWITSGERAFSLQAAEAMV